MVKQKYSKYDCASNGKEAFEKVKHLLSLECNICKIKTLTILMDIYMPIMDGIESAKLIDQIFQDDIIKTKWKVKLYFITGNTDSQYMLHVNQISVCAGYYNKPISKRDLLSII